MKLTWTAIGMLAAMLLNVSLSGNEQELKPIRWDFQNCRMKNNIPDGWVYRGKPFTPAPSFTITPDPQTGKKMLHIVSDKASGVILADLSRIDLKKYPIMRWKWKVTALPPGADGRIREKDDQVISIYAGYGRICQKSIAYMWQTETPKGATGHILYHGLVDVQWKTVRNKKDGLNRWYIEERNLYEDLKKGLKMEKLPKELAISICSNSQYTQSVAAAWIEYIEFCPETKKQ